MKSKSLLVFVLTLVAVLALGGCSLLPGGNNAGNATPTPPGGVLPFPTNVPVVTAAPGQPTDAASGNPQTISGTVYVDANGDGTQQADEQVIAGAQVDLAQGECPGAPAGQTTTTAEIPSFQFVDLPSGDYCVAINATSPANAAVLGVGEWTAPEKVQGTSAQPVRLRKRPIDNVNFGWSFSAIGEATPIAPQPTAEAGQPTPIAVIPTPTAFVQATAGPQPCVYRAQYLADITIPDNTIVAQGAQFVKTWRVVNNGTCSWGPGSNVTSLAFVGGDPLGAPNVVPLPNVVAVGATTDISINMVAPQTAGVFKSNWKLRADDGTLIGVGPSNVALYALIRVQSAVPPSPVPPPTGAPAPGQAIVFAAGATEAEAQGQLPANGIATFTLAALANQNMQLSLSSNSNSARIAVLSPTGAPLPAQRGNPEGTYWQGNLPVNGTYIIQVLAGNAAPTANFSLNVTIPVRITFAPGAISAQVQGTTSNGRIVTYLLKANGGQNMNAILTSPPNSAGITIYGLEDGQPLIRSQSGATSFNGQLPATQDYVIQVVPFGNTPVNFTLDITVQ